MDSGDDVEIQYQGARIKIGLDPIEWVIIGIIIIVCAYFWLR